MLMQGVVFDPSSAASPDGSATTVNLGRANDLLAAHLHGKYFEQCYRGNLYYASTVSGGVVIPIASTITPTYTIWNPAGSGKLCVPLVTLIGWRATTPALGSYVWHLTTNAGSNIATAGTFVAIGTPGVVVQNCNLGSGKVSAMFVATTGTTTLTPAATFYRDTGLNVLPTTAASVTSGWIWRDDWDGTGVIPPGNAIHLFGTTAIATTVTVSTVYAEIPL